MLPHQAKPPDGKKINMSNLMLAAIAANMGAKFDVAGRSDLLCFAAALITRVVC
jgi:hypothetical protein